MNSKSHLFLFAIPLLFISAYYGINSLFPEIELAQSELKPAQNNFVISEIKSKQITPIKTPRQSAATTTMPPLITELEAENEDIEASILESDADLSHDQHLAMLENEQIIREEEQMSKALASESTMDELDEGELEAYGINNADNQVQLSTEEADQQESELNAEILQALEQETVEMMQQLEQEHQEHLLADESIQ